MDTAAEPVLGLLVGPVATTDQPGLTAQDPGDPSRRSGPAYQRASTGTRARARSGDRIAHSETPMP